MTETLTKHFRLTEFACHDGTDVPEELYANVQELAKNLQVLRTALGLPIHITSGYRTPAWNRKIGGEPNSFHMRAMAADIKVAGFTPAEIKAEIEWLISQKRMKQGGIGVYPSFLHYDIRGKKARWPGSL